MIMAIFRFKNLKYLNVSLNSGNVGAFNDFNVVLVGCAINQKYPQITNIKPNKNEPFDNFFSGFTGIILNLLEYAKGQALPGLITVGHFFDACCPCPEQLMQAAAFGHRGPYFSKIF
jgi:hypothetical protein